jgi:uncharacterized phage protein (TIGR02218 family)
MRTLSTSLSQHLQSGATRLCWCWKLILNDGTRIGFTDHDQDLSFDGIVWRANSGIAPGVIETSTGFETGSAGDAGAIFDQFISRQDLETGKLDGARIEIWRVRWEQPNDRIGIWSGEIGEIKQQNTQFSAELVSGIRKFDHDFGRTFSKNCDAELGDAKCARDISSAPFRQLASIQSVPGPAVLQVDGLVLPEETWLVYGHVIWLDPGRSGMSARVSAHSQNGSLTRIELASAPRAFFEAGDQIALIAGCNKTRRHCSQKFQNILNFRGCPFMPGNDLLFADPESRT